MMSDSIEAGDVICPHCGRVMGWGEAQQEWVCPDCGYEGTLPEDPMSYVMPPCHAGAATPNAES